MKSIKGKILLIFLVFIVAIEAVFITFSSMNNIKSTKEAAETVSNALVQNVSELVAEKISLYQTVAAEIGCADIICSTTASADDKIAYLNKKVAQYGFERGDLIGADGKSITNGNDYNDRAWYQTSQKGTVAVSDPLIGKSTGKLANIIAAPIWKDGIANSTVQGAVYLVPPATYLDDIIKTIKISEHSEVYIASKAGLIIGCDKEGVVEMFTTYSDYTADASAKEALKSIEAQMSAGATGKYNFSFNGRETLAVYYPLGNENGWSVCAFVDTGDFMGNVYSVILFLIAIGVVVLVIGVICAFIVANKIGGNVKACSVRIEQLANGDLHSDVPNIAAKDETKILADSTRELTTMLSSIIGEINSGLSEMANGNFSIESNNSEQFVGDFRPLYDSVEQIPVKISKTLGKIALSADQVSGSSEQVANSAQALSQGATEQASAIEQLAATIAEIADNTKKNTEHAQEANNSVNAVGNAILESNEKMKELIKAMSDISESSAQIERIIKTIEDIAFQTNILALNAAVEAARAGEAGKGFAVVADEVRSLASKSAEAAKDTTTLIQNSVAAIAKGTEIVNVTAEALTSTVEGTQKVVSEINEITNASENQSTAIEQVTVGVDQISNVVQNNSATAEESAASSEELSSQANEMKTLLSTFKTRIE